MLLYFHYSAKVLYIYGNRTEKLKKIYNKNSRKKFVLAYLVLEHKYLNISNPPIGFLGKVTVVSNNLNDPEASARELLFH